MMCDCNYGDFACGCGGGDYQENLRQVEEMSKFDIELMLGKRSVKVYYQSWGLNFSDRRNWTAVFEDGEQEVFDYGDKDFLVRQCIKHGYDYKVVRCHNDGSDTILEQSQGDI